ncbi:MAG: VapC toxin family PIN domain ribonuclease [Gammaproteobacteria bacterium]|nr:VapC toxin family PIN domain ribonuclease [Gammaproteobacteria bacterium]
MILVDTSVWIEHFRVGNETLSRLLDAHQVWIHPFVIGEIACGNLEDRKEILSGLQQLPSIPVAMHSEVLFFLERSRLAGLGVGYVDLHLLAAVALAPPMRLWTRDQRLATMADGIGCAHG